MPGDGKIHFRCPHCDKPVGVALQHGGKRGKCPGCGRGIDIPEKTAAKVSSSLPSESELADQKERLKKELMGFRATNARFPSSGERAALLKYIDSFPRDLKDFRRQIESELKVFPRFEAAFLWVKYVPLPASEFMPHPHNLELSRVFLRAGEMARDMLRRSS